MVSCGRISFGILIVLTISVSIVQIGFGIYYVQKPVHCARSDFLTILILIGGFSSILSTIFVFCCCRGSGFSLKSSNPDHNNNRSSIN